MVDRRGLNGWLGGCWCGRLCRLLKLFSFWLRSVSFSLEGMRCVTGPPVREWRCCCEDESLLLVEGG